MAEITITLANPPADSCPADVEELFGLIRNALSGASDEESTSYVMQADTPSVGEQSLLWAKLDGSGRPLGIFKFYDGNWRRFYNGAVGEVKMFTGDPASYFDGTGKGILGTEWDGWALMNGSNGTVDISDKFIVAAHMNNSGGHNGYSSGWRSTVSGAPASTGGAATQTLSAANTYYAGRPEIKVWKWYADGNTGRVSNGSLYGISSTPGVSINLQEAVAANTSPTPLDTVPPWYAMAYCKFVGYT